MQSTTSQNRTCLHMVVYYILSVNVKLIVHIRIDRLLLVPKKVHCLEYGEMMGGHQDFWIVLYKLVNFQTGNNTETFRSDNRRI